VGDPGRSQRFDNRADRQAVREKKEQEGLSTD